MTVGLGGWMAVCFGVDGSIWWVDDTPHPRHSGRRSGTHLAMDGSWVYGAMGG
jgi:hypothetical protein